MRFIAVGIIALALIPVVGSAQSALRAPAAGFAVVPAANIAVQEKKGPTIESAAVGVRLAPTNIDAAEARARARRSGVGHAGALIIVGGGAMVAGSIMDGDPGTFFIVGGALVALYGLYLLVQ